jgi:hypothetical protein
MTERDAAEAMKIYAEATKGIQYGFETIWWVKPDTIPSPVTGRQMTNGAGEWIVKVGGEYHDGQNWFQKLVDFADYIQNRWPKKQEAEPATTQ